MRGMRGMRRVREDRVRPSVFYTPIIHNEAWFYILIPFMCKLQANSHPSDYCIFFFIHSFNDSFDDDMVGQ